MGSLVSKCKGENLDTNDTDNDYGFPVKRKSMSRDYVITNVGCGVGVSGTVKLVMIEKTLERFAHKRLIDDPKSIREIKLQMKASQNCDNILKIVDVYKHKSNYFDVVLEHASGGDLFLRINYRMQNNIPYTESEVKYMFRQMVNGVKHLHDLNIAHRDLKPENILVIKPKEDSKEFKLKICDFGFAKDVTDGLYTPCYTESYVPPEILKLNFIKYDASCDIWSLGVILYILLTFRFPFYSRHGIGLDSAQMREKIQNADYDFPNRDRWSPSLINLIEQMIVADPKQRLTIHQIDQNEWLNSPDSDLNPAHITISTNQQATNQEQITKSQESLNEITSKLEKFLAEIRSLNDAPILKPIEESSNPLLNKNKN